MNNMNNMNNINLIVKEKENNEKNNLEILFFELNNLNSILSNTEIQYNNIYEQPLGYIMKKIYINNDYLFYKEHSIKELLKICDFYNIILKKSQIKKEFLINIIINFENNISNLLIVEKRIQNWNYIYELMYDNKMKKYILW